MTPPTSAPGDGEGAADSAQLHLCHRCQNWRRGCFRAVDEVPYFSVLCAQCLIKCPQRVADHYAPIAPGASA